MQRRVVYPLFLIALTVGLLLPTAARADSAMLNWRVGFAAGMHEQTAPAAESFFSKDLGWITTIRVMGAVERPVTSWMDFGVGAAFAQRGPSGAIVRTAFEPEGTGELAEYGVRREYIELFVPLTFKKGREGFAYGLTAEPLIAWRLHAHETHPFAATFPLRELSLRAGFFVQHRSLRLGASYLFDREDTRSLPVQDRGVLVHLDLLGSFPSL